MLGYVATLKYFVNLCILSIDLVFPNISKVINSGGDTSLPVIAILIVPNKSRGLHSYFSNNLRKEISIFSSVKSSILLILLIASSYISHDKEAFDFTKSLCCSFGSGVSKKKLHTGHISSGLIVLIRSFKISKTVVMASCVIGVSNSIILVSQ